MIVSCLRRRDHRSEPGQMAVRPMKRSAFNSRTAMPAVAAVCLMAPAFTPCAHGNVSIQGFAGGGGYSYDLRLSLKHDGLRVNMNLSGQGYGYSSSGRGYTVKGSSVTPNETYNLYDYRRQSEQPLPSFRERSAKRSNDEFLIEPLSGNLLRLTRRVDAGTVQRIELFLADAGQKMLAVQTLTAAPFSATFDIVPGTAYVGHNIVWADGTTSTLFSPYSSYRQSGDTTKNVP
jgi:hypothetical protein